MMTMFYATPTPALFHPEMVVTLISAEKAKRDTTSSGITKNGEQILHQNTNQLHPTTSSTTGNHNKPTATTTDHKEAQAHPHIHPTIRQRNLLCKRLSRTQSPLTLQPIWGTNCLPALVDTMSPFTL